MVQENQEQENLELENQGQRAPQQSGGQQPDRHQPGRQPVSQKQQDGGQTVVVEEGNPRAFVTGTGFVFQGVGGTMLAGACVIWMAGNIVVPVSAPEGESWGDFLTPGGIGRLTAALGIMTSWVGALTLLATGVGLQGERPGSTRWAKFVAGGMLLIFLVCAVLLLVLGFQWAGALVFMGLSACSVILLALASRAAEVMRQHPPPEGYNEVTDEWVEEYIQERRRRRGM